MLVADFRAEMELDLQWRESELRDLTNRLIWMTSDPDQKVSGMRTLTVMEYAHIEGFATVAFGAYVNFINDSGIKFADLRPSIAAIALAPEFKRLRDGTTEIANDLLADAERQLKRTLRHEAFIAVVQNLSEEICVIDDAALDFEMNFGRGVLRNILHSLAIGTDAFESGTYGALEFLRNHRNDVAHGQRRQSFEERAFVRHVEIAGSFVSHSSWF